MKQTYRFGAFSDAETAHIVGLPAEEVFADNVSENARWFLPLLAVDLSELDPEWEGQVHFLYGGLETGGLHFHMKTEDGATQLVYKGEYDEFEEDDMDERDVKQGYMEFVHVPECSQRSTEDWHEERDEWMAIVERERSDLIFTCHIGGEPLWTQSDETPSCFRCDEVMLFVGQLRAQVFSDETSETDLFVFYCPRCSIQTQIDQSS